MSSGYRISPRITAVIPAYNAEEFVSAAIKSVLMQSAPIFECIVVDDGSRDGTGSAIGSFADRVRLIRTKNQGVAHARNIGIEAAKGDYIGFLDADDVWLPKKLERQIRKLTLQPDLAMIYSGLHLIDQHSRFIGEMRPAPGDIALERTLLLEKPFMTGGPAGRRAPDRRRVRLVPGRAGLRAARRLPAGHHRRGRGGADGGVARVRHGHPTCSRQLGLARWGRPGAFGA